MATTSTSSGSDGVFTVTFLHPRGGNQRGDREFPAELGPETTGQHALDGLIGAGFIEPPTQERAYTLQHPKTSRSLPLSEPLASQGIRHGDVVAVVQTSMGAARLSPTELRARLAFDAEVVQGLRAPSLGQVRPYASALDCRANRPLSSAEAAQGRAAFYTVEYTFPILTEPGTTTDKITVGFDLLARGNYPYTSPTVACLAPVAWNMHVSSSSGGVCIGKAWDDAQGKMLLAQLIVHVARILNWDEPDQGAAHDAFDPETLAYWEEELHMKPFHPHLVYPALPSELTHGVRGPGTLFRAAREIPHGAADSQPSLATARAARLFQPVRG